MTVDLDQLTVELLTRPGKPKNHRPFDGVGCRVGSDKPDPTNTLWRVTRMKETCRRSCRSVLRVKESLVSLGGAWERMHHLCRTKTAQIH